MTDKTYSIEEIRALSEALGVGQKHDAGTTPSVNPLQGAFPGNSAQYGIWSTAGVRPERFSTAPRMRSIGNILPFRRSVYTDNLIEIMTGVTNGAGNNSTSFCATAPTPGSLKTMQRIFRWGEVHIQTKVFSLMHAGSRRNTADVNGLLYNQALQVNPWLPAVPGIDNANDLAASVMRTEFFALGYQLERSVAQVHWSGTQGTQNSTYRGIQTQWDGLDAMIKTGYTDAVSGLAAPAADSIVDSFNAAIDGSDANGRDFVEAVTDIYRALNQRADAVGMGGTQWAIVMRPEMFQRAVEVWACVYATYRCSGVQYSEVNRDGMAIQALRTQMQGGQYLLIDNVPVPVVLDEGIVRDGLAANMFKSDMYIVPLAWGGQQLLYAEYFPVNNSEASELANYFGDDQVQYFNDGLYLVTKARTKSCVEFDFAARTRLILEAPFLAARLDDARYTVYEKYTLGNPADTQFYRDGGISYRS